jgi:phosphoribosylanthranilate isomerase
LIGMVPPLVSTVAVFRYPTPIDLQRVLGLVQPDLIQTEASSIIFETARNNAWHILPVLHDEPDFEDRLREVETHMTTDGPFVLEGQGRGGRGMKPDWGRASHLARSRRLVLAGGLNAHNVEDAVRRVRPWAVDVSSGVETSPGIKDANRIRAFVDAVRNAERHFNSAPKALT